jgi:hypothetical protein
LLRANVDRLVARRVEVSGSALKGRVTTAELERDCRELCTSLLPVADGDASSREVLTFSGLLDALGLWTSESYAAARDEIIKEHCVGGGRSIGWRLTSSGTSLLRFWCRCQVIEVGGRGAGYTCDGEPSRGEIMAGLFNRIKTFMRSPRGQQMTNKARGMAKDPRNRERARQAMQKLRRKR